MLALGAPPLVADFAMLTISAAILGYICHRVHLESVVGFLLAGAIIGPNALSLIADQEVVDGMAEIGVIFLMFAIGLELSGERLRKMGALMLGGGAIQVGLTIAIVTGLCSLWNVDIKTGIYTGCLVALSSTAVVLKLLSSRGATETQTGQIAVAFLIFQDIAVVVMVLLVPILGGEGGGLGDIAGALGKAAVVIAALLFGSKFVVPPFLDAVKKYADEEAFLFGRACNCCGLRMARHLLRDLRVTRCIHRWTCRQLRQAPPPGPALCRAISDGVRRHLLRIDRHAARLGVRVRQPGAGRLARRVQLARQVLSHRDRCPSARTATSGSNRCPHVCSPRSASSHSSSRKWALTQGSAWLVKAPPVTKHSSQPRSSSLP